jgi:pimeloyl-ACP methyl ester carboxylesterase
MNEQEDFYIKEDEITTGLKVIRFYFGKMGRFFPFVTKRLFWHLFTNPRKRKWLGKHQDYIDTGISHSKISTDYQREFVVHQFGTAPNKILLCHGWEGRTVDFQNIINQLTNNGFEVWSLDFPGHGIAPKGKSSLPVFRDVIYTICKEVNFHGFVGHSLGAASLALSFEKMKLNTPKYFVFMGLHPVPRNFVDQFQQITTLDDPTFVKCVTYGEKILQTTIADFDCHLHIDKFNENNILFIHDLKDRVIHKNRIEAFAKQLPKSETFIGDHGGHYVHFKHPEVAPKIVEFLQSTASI